MGRNARQLHGRSELLRPDGSIVPISGIDSTLLIDPAEWLACRQQLSENIGKTVSEILSAHPEHKAAFGLREGRTSATLLLCDILSLQKEPS